MRKSRGSQRLILRAAHLVAKTTPVTFLAAIRLQSLFSFLFEAMTQMSEINYVRFHNLTGKRMVPILSNHQLQRRLLKTSPSKIFHILIQNLRYIGAVKY